MPIYPQLQSRSHRRRTLITSPYRPGWYVITIDTTKSGVTGSTSVRISVAMNSATTAYDFDVDWGDGNVENFADASPVAEPTVEHDYGVGNGGVYVVQVEPTIQRVHYNNAGDILKLIEVNQWGDVIWATMDQAYYGCANLTGNPIDNPTFNGSWSLRDGVRDCTLMNWDVSGWDTTGLTSLQRALRSSTAFDQSLANWDISAVTTGSQFMLSAGISTANYNATLIAWAAQSVQSGVNMHFGGSTYTSAAQSARDTLTNAPNLWVITDGGLV